MHKLNLVITDDAFSVLEDCQKKNKFNNLDTALNELLIEYEGKHGNK